MYQNCMDCSTYNNKNENALKICKYGRKQYNINI